ncbi:TPA: DUF551 domain-containing protein [Klebsiella pneumoniae]|nr:DUF551 domain-containing protein [Klebsiella pneumoniae]MBG2411306.1 DUF551 domain-containing protein [Klebsiella pneumoniae]MCY3494561.1 DUF551 domain-containing protein [Klebsiella pneumoniae]HBS4090566.1 DUF551 domain-containing protein [Klebsiella pneumoniae]HED3582354.1 DUF551 domain-containing protein [Klebsiella pneumoniae]
MTMWPDEVLALTSALLAAKDSEPEYLPLDYLQGHRDGLEWAAQLAESNHPETGGRLYDDPIELAKAIRKGPDMPPVQPVPVVSADLLHTAASAIEDLLEHTDRNTSYYSGVWADVPGKLRAAAPQSPGSEPATAPGKWIPVSERMPEREVDVQVYCPDKKEQMVAYLERNELEGYFRFATWRTGEGIYCQPTHWMPLPAAPQEVKGE